MKWIQLHGSSVSISWEIKRQIIRDVFVWEISGVRPEGKSTSNIAAVCKGMTLLNILRHELFCFKTQNLECHLPSVYRICSDYRCIVELWLCWALQHKCTDHFLSKARIDTKYHVRNKFVALHVTKGYDATQCTKNTQSCNAVKRMVTTALPCPRRTDDSPWRSQRYTAQSQVAWGGETGTETVSLS